MANFRDVPRYGEIPIALLGVVKARKAQKQKPSDAARPGDGTGTDTARICGDNCGGAFLARVLLAIRL
jgi:hypothetical protein